VIFVDCGDKWKLLDINDLNVTVAEHSSGLPVRYVQVVTVKSGGASQPVSFLVCGMENRELVVFQLDLGNENQSLRVKEVQNINTDYAVRSMTYEPRQQMLVVGYFGEIVEFYSVSLTNSDERDQ